MTTATKNKKAQHTPGPWKWVEPSGTWISTEGDPYGHGEMHVADVRGWGHLTGQGACRLPEDQAIAVQTANALLIAAAPQLLACCKELREALAGAMRVLHNELLDDVFIEEMAALGIKDGIGVRVEDAIKKAEGS